MSIGDLVNYAMPNNVGPVNIVARIDHISGDLATISFHQGEELWVWPVQVSNLTPLFTI